MFGQHKRTDAGKRMRKQVFREGPKSVYDFEKYIKVGKCGAPAFYIEPAGEGRYHVLSVDEILERLDRLPKSHLRNLHTIVLPCMTKKRRRMHLYGLQWGGTIYLYPSRTELRQELNGPPYPNEHIEFEKYGGKVIQEGADWYIQWTKESIKHFYLENILVHELAHVYDRKNTRSVDRERFAEGYVLKYGSKSPHRL